MVIGRIMCWPAVVLCCDKFCLNTARSDLSCHWGLSISHRVFCLVNSKWFWEDNVYCVFLLLIDDTHGSKEERICLWCWSEFEYFVLHDQEHRPAFVYPLATCSIRRLSLVVSRLALCAAIRPSLRAKNTYYRPLHPRSCRDLPCVTGQSACRRIARRDPLCGGEEAAQASRFCLLCLLFFSRILTCSHFLSLLLP